MSVPAAFPRLGYVYAPASDHGPALPALLHVEPSSGIRIEVPFTSESHLGVAQWFHESSQPCPDQLLYQDQALNVHLLGTYVSGRTSDADVEAGVGTIHADHAVEDTDRSPVDYRQVSAVHSEIEGLHEFMGWRLTQFEFPPDDRRTTVLRATAPDPVDLGEIEGFQVSLVALAPSGQDRPNVSAVSEKTLLRTKCEPPRDLDEHLAIHKQVRDLIALACWRPIDFRVIRVHRDDAPALSFGRSSVGAAFRMLHSPGLLRRHTAETPPELRFGEFLEPANFDSIGVAGITRWMEVRDSLSRFTDPLLSLLYAPVITPQMALMQTSISAEALGYFHAIRSGTPAHSVKNISFYTRLDRITKSQPLPLDQLVGKTRKAWLQAASAAYNGVKHANLDLPTHPVPTLMAWTMTILLRSQLLLEIGLDHSTVGKLEKHQSWWGLAEPYRELTNWPRRGSSSS